MATYNGHKCWAYWNVSLWLNNDEGLYKLCTSRLRIYHKNKATDMILEALQANGESTTPDGARYSKSAIRAALTDF